MKIIYKILQFLQFSFLQDLYLILLKIVLWLMNYWIWTEQNGEKKVLKIINNYLKKLEWKPIIFDVWANKWQYLRDINQLIDSPSVIFSFEPIKDTFNSLKENTTYKSIHDINLINVWLWAKNETQNIYFSNFWDDPDNSCASILKDNITNFVDSKISNTEVAITTIDNFCKKNNISHIDFLKIDIEWYELDCIKWARNMINSLNIDIIQLEHNRCAIASRTFFRDYWDIFSENYIICRPLANNKWLYQIKKYDIYLENFTYINYVFIKKDIYKKILLKND